MFDSVSFLEQISVVRFVAFLKVKKASMKNAAGLHEAAFDSFIPFKSVQVSDYKCIALSIKENRQVILVVVSCLIIHNENSQSIFK